MGTMSMPSVVDPIRLTHKKHHDDHSDERDTEDETWATRFLNEALTCSLTLERMKDPVILCCTDPSQPSFGHVYDKEILCQSLLINPDLDPRSNCRYSAPLFYVPCRWLQQYLKIKGQYVPYDDAYFARAYERAWRQSHVPLSRPLGVQRNHPAPGGGGAAFMEAILRYSWGATLLALYLNGYPDDDYYHNSVISGAWGTLTIFALGLICYQEFCGRDGILLLGVAVLTTLVIGLQMCK